MKHQTAGHNLHRRDRNSFEMNLFKFLQNVTEIRVFVSISPALCLQLENEKSIPGAPSISTEVGGRAEG